MMREKVTWYLKALPKAWRNRLLPLPEVVTAFLERSDGGADSLRAALRAFVAARLGEALSPEVWDDEAPPPHLRIQVRVVDAAGRELAAGATWARCARSLARPRDSISRRPTRVSSARASAPGTSAIFPRPWLSCATVCA